MLRIPANLCWLHVQKEAAGSMQGTTCVVTHTKYDKVADVQRSIVEGLLFCG
jgi:hypothetical protein